MKELKNIIDMMKDAFEGADESEGPVESFMKKELSEPEHAKSAASGSLEDFAKEEEAEPEHAKSTKDKDIMEWAGEEDAEECMKHCIKLDDEGNLLVGDKNFGNPDNVIKYIEELKTGSAEPEDDSEPTEDASELPEDTGEPKIKIKVRRIVGIPE